jgi:hypothetical protein
VTFSLDTEPDSARAAYLELSRRRDQLGLPYHDMMALDEGRAVIRFNWDAPRTLVDQTASWLESVPFVSNVRRHYGAALE